MKTAKLQEQIVRELLDIVSDQGFVITDTTMLTVVDEQKNTIRIATGLDRYGKTASLKFWVGKRYDRIESLVEKYINYIDLPARDMPFTYTLRFNENDLNGKFNAGAGYLFDGREENIGKLIAQVGPVIKNKLLPFLEKLQSYEALHDFINNPPQTYRNNAYFFSKDGMTPFRKMIIAKIVNKDYEAVCDWVLNDMIGIQLKADSIEKYENYKKVYFDLRKDLDERY